MALGFSFSTIHWSGVLYFFLGVDWKRSKNKISAILPEDILKNNFSHLIEDQKKIIEIMHEPEYSKFLRIAKLTLNTGYSPIVLNNKIKIFDNGESLFDTLCNDLERAKETINMQYFIWRSDCLGNRIKDILIKKSKEGVKVRLIFDGLGSIFAISRKYKEELKKNNILFHYFHDPFTIVWSRFINYRNHRKIVVIDGLIGYSGGMNVGQEYIDGGKRFDSWRDIHFRVEGESVMMLQNVFLSDWFNCGARDIFTHNDKNNLLLNKDIFFPDGNIKSTLPIQVITSGPDSYWDAIHKVYIRLISEAEETVQIASPYFVPDEALILSIENASLAGVKVDLMITGCPDKKIPWYVAHTYFERLLKAGANIYMYNKGFLHSKFVVMDSQVVSVGTCNMDARSFFLHYEINFVLYDEKEAKKFNDIFENDIKYSHKVTLKECEDLSVLKKLRNSVLKTMSDAL